jgi:hypothetical protein
MPTVAARKASTGRKKKSPVLKRKPAGKVSYGKLNPKKKCRTLKKRGGAPPKKVVTNSKVAPVDSSNNSGEKPASTTKREVPPIALCKREARRKIGQMCMANREACPIIQECSKYGVGSDFWPLDTDAVIPDSAYKQLGETPEGRKQMHMGKKCVFVTMGNTKEFAEEFEECNRLYGTHKAPANSKARGSKTSSKTSSKTTSKTTNSKKASKTMSSKKASKPASSKKTASKINAGL